MSNSAEKDDPLQMTNEQIADLVRRAEKGDRTTLPALRRVFEHPEAVDVLGGDLARQAQLILIDKFSGKNLVFKEALPRKLESMRAELAGAEPTPLERLLVERIVTCWLQLHHLEALYSGAESMSLELGTYYQRSIDRAQKRYLAAIKTLALIRKLALPALQVNIARRQVNVAGS